MGVVAAGYLRPAMGVVTHTVSQGDIELQSGDHNYLAVVLSGPTGMKPWRASGCWRCGWSLRPVRKANGSSARVDASGRTYGPLAAIGAVQWLEGRVYKSLRAS